jgi:predicted TIM-barrel fold metal-dependent hydrolase
LSREVEPLFGALFMLRRDVLKSLLVVGGASAVGARGRLPQLAAKAAQAQPRVARRFVDAHCHFFNAADIPIRGFLERVVFEDYPDTQVPSQTLQPSLDLPIWRGLVATLADFLLRSSAPTPRQELQCLAQAAACGDFSALSPESPQGLAASEAPATDAKTRVLGNVLQERFENRRSVGAEPSPGAADQQDVDAFIDAVLDEMKSQGRVPPEVTARSLQSGAAPQAGIFDNVASFLFGSTLFGRYFRWARLLTGYRASIAQTYQALYDPAGTRLILATPALVDYNFWLEDQSPAALREQVEVMSRISLRQRHPIHGFVAFDPLRELRHKADAPSALSIVQEAIRDFGFIGVKLYSPMGFRPSGNAEGIGFPAFAIQNERDFGTRLDQALDTLYAWCEAEQVPILAHTFDSQAANVDFGARANPKFWQRVLESKPELRLNMAHFGNFIFAASGNATAAEKFKSTWEFQIGTFIKNGQFKNVYADLSYFTWVLGEGRQSPRRAQIKAMLSEYLSMFDPNAERLLLGTDWTMMARENGADIYVDSIEAFLIEIGLSSAQLDNIFYKNALRFLGLSEPTKASERLKGFYQANNKPMPSFA